MKRQFVSTLWVGMFSLGVIASADAALISRLGGQAYYDTDLDITWLADVQAGAGSVFDDGTANDGRMSWENANNWAASITVDGVTGWRLPTVSPIDGVAFNESQSFNGSTDRSINLTRPGTPFGGSTASELAHLFYNTLGNISDFNISGAFDNGCSASCLTNTGPFTNLTSLYHWANIETSDSLLAFAFGTSNGSQDPNIKTSTLAAWAVHDGDIDAVPVPAAAWLFGSGLLGLIGVARRKNKMGVTIKI